MGGADELLYSWGPGESRLVLVEGGRLVECAIARADLVAGAIFLGRVVEVAPHIDAAFVDIGLERPGFLPGAAGRSQGQALLVQVRADAWAAKGALLTADVSLAGRWLAYSPLRPGLSASRRLLPDDRDRLLALAARLVEPDEGVVLRTAAATRTEAELRAELDALRADWEEIEERRHGAKVPALVWRPDPLIRVLADNPQVERVRIDDAALFAAARKRFGTLVEHHRDGALFEAAGIEDDLAEALAPLVALPGGGRVAIEPTAALTAVDVDSGAGRPADANREAVDAIARQLRLRAVGGQIVVDFISGGGKGALFKLVGALRRALSADPTPTHVFGVTPLGLVELTRERRGPSLADLLTERDTRPSPKAAAFAALRRVLAEAAHRPGRPLALVVAPEVAAALARLPGAVAEAEARLGLPLAVRSEPGRAREDVMVEEAGR
ncbi:MAG: ribonuclease E/G [Magnetospirillum sp.]|nr:ribonuclease E/G [Magnetospirillum sp.]